MTDDEWSPPPHGELRPHGDGEYEPHRPPKYVEGVYKPHSGIPDADYAVMTYPLDPGYEPWLAEVDELPGGHTVLRKPGGGRPCGSGGTTVSGWVFHADNERLREVAIGGNWEGRIDEDDVLELLEEAGE